MKVSDYIANFLAEKDIEHIFTISGAGDVHLLNSVADHPKLSHVCPHHEQAAVMASLAYNRISGKMSAVIVTMGGGCSNAITGVVNGWADSVPCLIISGQEKTQYIKEQKNLRMWGVQGFDIARTVSNITKYSALVMEPAAIRFHLEKAYYLATTGRPGPVWLDIPLDVQSAQVNPEKMQEFEPEKPRCCIDHEYFNSLLGLIRNSSRPVFILGNGIRIAGAAELVPLLLEKFPFPALTAWNGADLFPASHPLYFGHEGNYGQRCANFIVQNCDLLITIGTRLAIPQIGYEMSEFAREARKFVVDIDMDELSKFEKDPSFIPVCSDAKDFIVKLLEICKNEEIHKPYEWIKRCEQWKNDYPVVNPLIHTETDGFLNSYAFIDELSAHFSDKEIVVTDMGTALTCTHQAITLNKNQRLITSTGLGEMGYGMPGAIGASFATGKGRVVLITGDGSMMMNLQEMQTIIHHRLPVKMFIFINDAYLTIKNTQIGLFGRKFTGSDKASGVTCPDYIKLGKAFGFRTFQLKKSNNMSRVIQQVLSSDGPALCEVYIHPLQPHIPKLSFSINPDGSLVSPPIEDLFPFLPREQLKKEMIIGLHEKSKKIIDN